MTNNTESKYMPHMFMTTLFINNTFHQQHFHERHFPPSRWWSCSALREGLIQVSSHWSSWIQCCKHTHIIEKKAHFDWICDLKKEESVIMDSIMGLTKKQKHITTHEKQANQAWCTMPWFIRPQFQSNTNAWKWVRLSWKQELEAVV